jgi:hypothetical protein
MLVIKNFPRGGFALLYAVLVVSIVLTISLSLFNITYKQILLSSVVRESQVAFYAADSALRCAVHQNNVFIPGPENPFGYYQSAGGGTFTFVPPGPVTFSCNNEGIEPSCADIGSQHQCSFTVVFDLGNREACARVDVIKEENELLATINSRGYNLYDGATCPSQESSRVVERAWTKSYNQIAIP